MHVAYGFVANLVRYIPPC